MNYAELAVMQASRAKTFSTAQTDAMTAYCQAEHDLKELQAENVKLQDENARMRSCLSDDAENARMIMGENVKLRELVRDIADHIKHGDGFGIDRGWMLDRICELGIEVER